MHDLQYSYSFPKKFSALLKAKIRIFHIPGLLFSVPYPPSLFPLSVWNTPVRLLHCEAPQKLQIAFQILAEIIKYAQQYKDNRSYHISYKKAKNPDAYFRRYESQIILYDGARRMLEQAGINLKGLNVDKLNAEYQELMKQKSELTSTYKDCEKEVRELKRKQENLNQYLGKNMPTTQDIKNRQQSL